MSYEQPCSTPPTHSAASPAPAEAAGERPASYQPPRLEALGRWEAVTLIGSIGFNSVPGLGQNDR